MKKESCKKLEQEEAKLKTLKKEYTKAIKDHRKMCEKGERRLDLLKEKVQTMNVKVGILKYGENGDFKLSTLYKRALMWNSTKEQLKEIENAFYKGFKIALNIECPKDPVFGSPMPRLMREGEVCGYRINGNYFERMEGFIKEIVIQDKVK